MLTSVLEMCINGTHKLVKIIKYILVGVVFASITEKYVKFLLRELAELTNWLHCNSQRDTAEQVMITPVC